MTGITLSGITWDHPRGLDPLVAASDLYENLFGVKVIWQKRSLTDFGDQSLSALAGKYDLLIIDHPHAGVACETKCLFPLEEILPLKIMDELKDQTAGPSFSSYNYQGKQWAIPVDAAVQCSVFRQDMMGDIPVPESWREVFELVRLLKQKNLKIGMALCPTDSLCSFLTITAQLGCPVREGNEMLVSRETGLKALEMMRSMRDNFHENSLHRNPVQLYEHMSNFDDIAYAPLAFGYTNYSRTDFREKKLCFGNAPGIKNSVLGGAGIAVSAECKYFTEAARFAAWIGSSAVQKTIYVREQGQPGNGVAWMDDFANGITGNFFFNTAETLTHAYVRPRYSGWPVFQKYLGEALYTYLQDDADPVNVLLQLEEAYALSYANLVI